MRCFYNSCKLHNQEESTLNAHPLRRIPFCLPHPFERLQFTLLLGHHCAHLQSTHRHSRRSYLCYVHRQRTISLQK